MLTNNEIIDKEEMEWIVPDDAEGRAVLNKMLNKARKSATKELVAELDKKFTTQLHKVSDLKKDNSDTIWCIKEKDYNAIKKKHGVLK